MSLACAIRIEDLEADESLLNGATKACFDCDLDNPRRVTQEKCTTCCGTGRQELAAKEIAIELRASKSESQKGSEGGKSRLVDEDDLYLEY